MLSPRRFLPALAWLSAFESTARLHSVTAAAKELHLTQSAVSRQIKALESLLNVELFHRERQTLRLTPGGEAYARDIREALKTISSASLSLKANPLGGTLKLGILPTFAARWLAPRLPEFLAQNTGLKLNLLTRISVFDFRAEGLDAAIHYGADPWPGVDMALIRHEDVVPACHPKLKERFRFQSPEDLRKAPLLHITSRPDAWERWLEQYGAPYDGVQGMLFDQFSTLIEVTRSGLGIALLPRFLIEEEWKSHQLIAALDLPMRSRESYYLVWPQERANHPPLVAFRNWLLNETRDFR